MSDLHPDDPRARLRRANHAAAMRACSAPRSSAANSPSPARSPRGSR